MKSQLSHSFYANHFIMKQGAFFLSQKKLAELGLPTLQAAEIETLYGLSHFF